MSLRGIVLLTYFVGSLPVCFFRPFYGILLWIVVAFLNPQAFTWGAAQLFPWALAVAVPTVAGLLIFGGNWGALQAREAFLLALLWIWFGVTTVVSTSTPAFIHHAVDTWYRLNFVSKILFMAFMMVPVVTTFERLRWLVMIMAGSFGAYVAKGFPFLVMTGGAHRMYGPENSMIADNNDFGLALNMTLPLFFFLAQTETRPWVKRMFGALFVMTIPVIFFTYSRGALVGLIAVSTLMFVQLKQRLLLIPVIVVAVLMALMFAPDSWRNRMDPTRKDAVDASARSRLNAWAYARALAADYPITGGGFATFTPELFVQYAPNALDIHGPHSVYFQILAEHGYVGLLLYLSILFSCFLTTYTIVKRARSRGDTTIIHYANMFRFSLVGFMVSGTFLGRAYFDYVYTIVMCVVILKAVAKRRWVQEDLLAEEDWEAEEEFEEIDVTQHRRLAWEGGQ